MGTSDDRGEVENEGDMLIALQGRLLTQERLIDTLLLDYVARARKTTFADAASQFSDLMIASAQRIEIPLNPYADDVWEEAGKALRLRLAWLQERAAKMDSL